MNIEEFRKLCKRKVNKDIAEKMGYVCNDNWHYNQNAMCDGPRSNSYANLTLLENAGDSHFSHIGWNPFNDSSSALELMTKFQVGWVDIFGLDVAQAREVIVHSVYSKFIHVSI